LISKITDNINSRFLYSTMHCKKKY